MSNSDLAQAGSSTQAELPSRLPFPPVTKQHILNCSCHNWHPKYRSVTPKARLIPLPDAFVDYLKADGIILPPEDSDRVEWSDHDSAFESSAENDGDDEEDNDPSAAWRDTHNLIRQTIDELGGKVVPKLNWSAPKDATWINVTNSMDCTTPNDIYLLLKSSDFVSHDLAHAFDDTDEDPEHKDAEDPVIPYHLVLRKFAQVNPSLEFRCFVRNRKLIAISQRDPNHFDFLAKMKDDLRRVIMKFFDKHIKNTFPDPNFTFDVYVPPPHNRVWLVDFNPWAMRTDPLLFSWLELLTMPEPAEAVPQSDEDEVSETVFLPELRLINKDDPEAFSFAASQYSAHKLPKDVIDASRSGGSDMVELAREWAELQRRGDAKAAGDADDSE